MLVVAGAFLLLLLVGFDNVLALLRSRVALFLAIAPLFVLFVWLVYKAFQPHRLADPTPREKKVNQTR
jgi:hypothetical protein